MAEAADVAVFPQLGHKSLVCSVSFSPDGKWVVSSSEDTNIKLWDTASGRELYTFSGNSVARSVAFSPDGTRIVSGHDDCTIKLWDIATRKEIRTISGHSNIVWSVAFSPDGKQIVSGDGDDTIKLWDTDSGQLIHSSGNSTPVWPLAVHPTRQYIISGNIDLKLWDIVNGKEIRTFSGHRSTVMSVAFSPDGKQIVSGAGDNTLKLWDTDSGELIHTFLGHSDWVMFVGFSPDGKQIVSWAADNTLKLWDTSNGQEIRSYPGITSWPLVFTLDGKLWTWDNESSMAIEPPDGELWIWDRKSSMAIEPLDIQTFQKSLILLGPYSAFSPDRKHIVSQFSDYNMKLRDSTTGLEIYTLSGHSAEISSVAFSPDGRHIISGSWDKTIKLWDVETGREVHTFSGHNWVVISVAFSSNGKHIISTSYDGTTRLWDAATGKEIASFIGFNDGEWIVITPDGYYNASPKGDQYLNVRIGNEVYGVDQFAETFYQPEVVQARLQGLPDPPVVKERGSIQTASIPPAVKVTVTEENAAAGQALLSVTATDWIRQIRDIEIIINGRLVGGGELRPLSARGLAPTSSRLEVTSEDRQYEFTISVNLDPGLNHIEVVAANSFNYGLKTVYVNSPRTREQKGDLWVFAIGVNDYADNPNYEDLNYAVSDAEKIAGAFREQEGKRFNKVHTLVISDKGEEKPTREKILGAWSFLGRRGRMTRRCCLWWPTGRRRTGCITFCPPTRCLRGTGSLTQGRR
ncbi:MAG: WD40 repeat domain-containing protein [Treponema sp.]|nr:WD40 repeat domain-containing protein [Treponema sp.]